MVSEAVDDVAFRGALGRFASGVTVITTNVDGIDHAMTASAFTSVSLSPPQVLVCSHKTSRFHEAVSTSRRWTVSILSEAGADDSAWFAHRGRPLDRQFEGIEHRRTDSGLAILDNALAWLECETTAEHDGADHVILVGRVVWAAVNHASDDPLLYYRSHYGTIIRSDESEKTLYERRS